MLPQIDRVATRVSYTALVFASIFVMCLVAGPDHTGSAVCAVVSFLFVLPIRPFWNRACLLEDVKDMQRLRISDARNC